MLHVGSVCTPCCILLDVVVFCCAKFETCQTFSTLQTGATLLANKPDVVESYMLRPFAHPVAFCWMSLPVFAQSLKPVKLLALLPIKLIMNSKEPHLNKLVMKFVSSCMKIRDSLLAM